MLISAQRCAWTGFWIFWTRNLAVSGRFPIQIFLTRTGSGLDLDFGICWWRMVCETELCLQLLITYMLTCHTCYSFASLPECSTQWQKSTLRRCNAWVIYAQVIFMAAWYGPRSTQPPVALVASRLQYGCRRNTNALRERGHIELIEPILAIIAVGK